MDPKSPGDPQSLKFTLDEHEGCMRLVAETESILGSALPPPSWLGRLRETLPRLSETLEAHFVAEEEAALFRELPMRKPRLAERIERLAVEHGKLLAGVRDVVDRAESVNADETLRVQEFRARVALLIATIRRHEAEENEILMEAYWDELGAAD